MSRSPARLTDRKPRAATARSTGARRDPPRLAKVELELRDGRYLLAYSRATTSDHA
ncbi:MAG TPA: hypothetical protein VIO80_04345 [Candidatus Dormibacteraeota bacterium]